MNFIIIQLWKLLAAHAVTDCFLQDSTLSKIGRKKNRNLAADDAVTDWPYWLWAHGCINGIGVWVVTGDPILGMMESFAHAIIDFGKCEKYYGLHTDQFFHFSCKLIYATILWSHYAG